MSYIPIKFYQNLYAGYKNHKMTFCSRGFLFPVSLCKYNFLL